MFLKNKVVLVTGSTTGIGAAIASRCVAEGAKVMLHGRNEERARILVSELGEDNAAYCIADLLSQEVHNILIQAVLNRFNRLDVLINNAGIYPRTTIDSLNMDYYNDVMTINFRCPLFLIQKAVKVFRKQGHGNVVNIGSINAYCGEVGMSVYAPSKGALMTATRNLGNELGPDNIRINLLNAGWTLTETEDELKRNQGFSNNWEQYIPKTYAPSGKLLRPEQIAKHAVFWASDESAPANGQVYDLEQYPMIGRNLIHEISLDIFKDKK